MQNSYQIVGVMGGGETCSEKTRRLAYDLGEMIAEEGWVLLNGGRASGVMQASARGAKEAGGLTIGILPGQDKGQANHWIDLPLPTDLGNGRNYINVLASDCVVALPGRAGTISEIALALKSHKPVIALQWDLGHLFETYLKRGLLIQAEDMDRVKEELKRKMGGTT